MAAKPEALSIGVLHGPNLDLLGTREPEVYGGTTLAEIDERMGRLAAELDASVEPVQSNVEGVLIDAVHELAGRVHGFVVNPAGYTHTSVALLDALRGVDLPYVEVHLTNIAGREPYRQRSLFSAGAVGVVSGFGADSYELGLRALVLHLRRGTR